MAQIRMIDEDNELIQTMQTALGGLQIKYGEAALEFWALRLAWEAVRLAWYAIAQHSDGGKLERVESALRELQERLPKGEMPSEENS